MLLNQCIRKKTDTYTHRHTHTKQMSRVEKWAKKHVRIQSRVTENFKFRSTLVVLKC